MTKKLDRTEDERLAARQTGQEIIKAEIAKAYKPLVKKGGGSRTIPKGTGPDGNRRVHRLWNRRCVRCGVSDLDLGWREIKQGACTGDLDG